MKNVSIFLLGITVVFLLAFSFATKKDYNARVDKVQGIPVYIMSEPLDDYEVVASENNPSREYSIRATVDKLITRIRKKEDRNRIGDFDAVIIADDGSKATLIKYIAE
ncbi:hypothetical protein V9L05_08600 [Bernardetia sp. Wsw4-3y2]|uniref:hypothetical protein n=1 Tax=Bernardetia sp. Wsw4-3y2 TaxID=3127471 RepID=UPI0030CFA20D